MGPDNDAVILRMQCAEHDENPSSSQYALEGIIGFMRVFSTPLGRSEPTIHAYLGGKTNMTTIHTFAISFFNAYLWDCLKTSFKDAKKPEF